MKKLHIQEAADVVAAWDNGTPLKALCGYTRVTTEAEYEAIRETAPTCRSCDRIFRALAAKGEASEYPRNEPADKTRERARKTQWWSVTFQKSGNSIWSWPLAS